MKNNKNKTISLIQSSLLFIITAAAILLCANSASATSQDAVIFSSDLAISIENPATSLVINSGSEILGFMVNNSNIQVNMEAGSIITVTSYDRKALTASGGAAVSTCASNYSKIVVSSNQTETITITPSSAACDGSSGGSGGGGGGGGGGGSSSGGAVIIGPSTGSSGTSGSGQPTQTMTREQLVAEIARISSLITELQKQLLAMTGQGAGAAKITANLWYGHRGSQVKLLQIWLAKDKAIYPEGIASGFFGQATKRAVIRFQERYSSEVLRPAGLTKGTGMVGSLTRDKLNALYGY
jgi:hypothetical protein